MLEKIGCQAETTTHQCWIDEAYGRLSRAKPLLVDFGKDRSEGGRAGRGSSYQDADSLVENDNIVANSRKVGVPSTQNVIDTTIGAEAVVVDAGVVRMLRSGDLEVLSNGGFLIRRLLKNSKSA